MTCGGQGDTVLSVWLQPPGSVTLLFLGLQPAVLDEQVSHCGHCTVCVCVCACACAERNSLVSCKYPPLWLSPDRQELLQRLLFSCCHLPFA